MGLGRLPHAPTDAKGNEQGYHEEDAHVYPPRDFRLYDILLQPCLHASVADGEGYYGRYTLQGHVFDDEHIEDVFRSGTEYLAYGNLLSSLFTGEHNHRPHTEEGDEDADDGGDGEEFLQIEFGFKIGVKFFL